MIILDTHIWLWWVNNDAVSLKAEWGELIDNASEVGISAISCFEVAWLERHNRITLPFYQEPSGLKRHWMAQVLVYCLFLLKLLGQQSICKNTIVTPKIELLSLLH